MNENPIPVPVANEPAAPGALASLLARLKGGVVKSKGVKAKRRGTPGAFGRECLRDQLAKQRAANPAVVEARHQRKEQRLGNALRKLRERT
jgi:hypothetical protein